MRKKVNKDKISSKKKDRKKLLYKTFSPYTTQRYPVNTATVSWK